MGRAVRKETAQQRAAREAREFARGWRPQLRGKIFCSPRCGADCTKAEHDLAVAKAANLARTLGPGWKPRVWENMGWFWEAVKGGTQVHRAHSARGQVSVRGLYSANLHVGGKQFWCDGPTPRTALQASIGAAEDCIREMKSDLERLTK